MKQLIYIYYVIINKKVNLIYASFKKNYWKPCLNVTRYYISWFQTSEKDVQETVQDREFVHGAAQTSASH